MRLGYLAILSLIAAAVLPPLAAPQAEDVSAWTRERDVSARLVAGASSATERWAALEIVLASGFKTYWRDPGESGLPPIFDWSASTNFASADILWPAPRRLDEAGGTVNGYTGRLVLPIKIVPASPSAPTRLVLAVDFGVCRDLCIPVRMSLALDLERGMADQPDDIADALLRVPKVQAVAASGPLSVLSLARNGEAGKPTLDITVRVPIASAPQLFVEAPPNWFLAVSDPLRLAGGEADIRVFHAEIVERPRDAPQKLPLTVTLVAEESAIETTLTLDGADLPR